MPSTDRCNVAADRAFFSADAKYFILATSKFIYPESEATSYTTNFADFANIA